MGKIQCIVSAMLNVQRLVEYAVDFTDRYMKKNKKIIMIIIKGIENEEGEKEEEGMPRFKYFLIYSCRNWAHSR